VTVTQKFAKAHHLTSIDQLKPIEKEHHLRRAAGAEDPRRGLVGLKNNYGLVFKAFKPLDESGPITWPGWSTTRCRRPTSSPHAADHHRPLVALADPKFNFAAQNVTRWSTRRASPRGRQHAERDLGQADPAGLLAMDKDVIVNHAQYATVATAWLKSVGIKS